ncbi:hypothetical protein [Gimesia fumaroli]|uniref:DUF1877 domain-containing protein n=1 Tax=Gimesia fumaroli TaxID=2527976 RepID=A0A518ICD2_9PLAN|nr:hypothetical protein [Gimesia fumaroli]QDV50755.1 hypothetical protein Enr17x_27980 [Gimesia fumaroli]
MSRSTAAYSVDLETIRNLDVKEAKGYAQLYIEDLKLESGLNPDDEIPSEEVEYYRDDEEIIKKIFNLGDGPEESNCCLINPFRWLCKLFGTQLDGLGDSLTSPLTIDALWLKSSLLDDYYNPPFGFPPHDENIGHLTLEEIKKERELIDGCVEETYEESCPVPVGRLPPEMLERDIKEWNEIVLPARKDYLEWLDFCIREKTDLIIIET